MAGGSGDSHLPKVLNVAELALDKNRLLFNIRRVLLSACHHRDFRLLVVVSTNDKQRLLFGKHDLIVE